MLFNSHVYIFGFLPLTAVGFNLLLRRSLTASLVGLTVASLVFYAWWNPAYLLLLIPSILGNYCAGRLLVLTSDRRRRQRWILAGSIAANLVVLGFFKYSEFVASNVSALTGQALPTLHTPLPLAISFFTLGQIAFLVDVSRGKTAEPSLLVYATYVTFFPHLIAGPIIRHQEIAPQFRNARLLRSNWHDLSVGLTLFSIGLFKKSVLGDSLADLADPAFNVLASGKSLTFLEAWIGILAFTFQIYFDFSGYTDMATGSAKMLGLTLPINFLAPYQATSVSEFWRRWHVSLSRFLRDYVYIPLGGNRHGEPRRRLNLLLTMLIGGLWHGPAWTFVFWGGLHGTSLIVDHGWQAHRQRRPHWPGLHPAVARACTFLAVVVAWVFFRAPDWSTALGMLRGMAGQSGLAMDPSLGQGVVLLALSFLLTQLVPDSVELVGWVDSPPAEGAPRHARRVLRWRPTTAWSLITATLFLVGLLFLVRQSPFIYFEF